MNVLARNEALPASVRQQICVKQDGHPLGVEMEITIPRGRYRTTDRPYGTPRARGPCTHRATCQDQSAAHSADGCPIPATSPLFTDGYMHITDRAKDVIVRRRVDQPIDVENAARGIPFVCGSGRHRHCASEGASPLLVACARRATSYANGMLAFLNERLRSGGCRSCRLRDAIPHTATGQRCRAPSSPISARRRGDG